MRQGTSPPGVGRADVHRQHLLALECKSPESEREGLLTGLAASVSQGFQQLFSSNSAVCGVSIGAGQNTSVVVKSYVNGSGTSLQTDIMICLLVRSSVKVESREGGVQCLNPLHEEVEGNLVA